MNVFESAKERINRIFDDFENIYVSFSGGKDSGVMVIHRYLAMVVNKTIMEREEGYLPVVVIDKPIQNRMASTIRHNRARGTHSIELMTNIVAELKQAWQTDTWIMKHIGMDADELLRLKQLSGLAELFKDRDFSEPNFSCKELLYY